MLTAPASRSVDVLRSLENPFRHDGIVRCGICTVADVFRNTFQSASILEDVFAEGSADTPGGVVDCIHSPYRKRPCGYSTYPPLPPSSPILHRGILLQCTNLPPFYTPDPPLEPLVSAIVLDLSIDISQSSPSPWIPLPKSRAG
jgi:hypothetical protein